MKRYLILRDYAYSTKINLEGRMKIQSERAIKSRASLAIQLSCKQVYVWTVPKG